MQAFCAMPNEIVRSVWKNWSVIKALSGREISGKYRGSYLGGAWSLVNPIFMLLVYTFVFGVVFKARWSGEGESQAEFALVLFLGLMVFNLFSECLNRAPSLIVTNVNYVKKIVFPLEVLPCVSLVVALFHMLISLAVWIVAYVFIIGSPPATIFWLPAILFPLFLLILGSSWIFSSLGVYFRDVSHLVLMFTSVLMFVTPIFYPLSALPQEFQNLLSLSPLSAIVENVRTVMFMGETPDLQSLAWLWGGCPIFCWLGFVWFQKTRRGFADVL